MCPAGGGYCFFSPESCFAVEAKWPIAEARENLDDFAARREL